MSSREDGKKWMTFCKHMREAIIDEQKAVPDYNKLITQANALAMLDPSWRERIDSVVSEIIEDEKRHKRDLLPIFDRICPRMAIHRKGVK